MVNEYQKGADGTISIDRAKGKARFRVEKPILMRDTHGLKIDWPETYPTLQETYLTIGTNGNHIADGY